MIRNAVHYAFLNTLKVGTSFPRVPAAFQQWEQRSHVFPLEMTPDCHAPQHLADYCVLLYSRTFPSHLPGHAESAIKPTPTKRLNAFISSYLRSTERNQLQVPQGHQLNTYDRRALAVASPSTWNSFPNPVRNPNSTEAAFRRLLETFLFTWY